MERVVLRAVARDVTNEVKHTKVNNLAESQNILHRQIVAQARQEEQSSPPSLFAWMI